MLRKRILLVGDPSTVERLESLIRLSGCEPVVPSCVSEALAAAESGRLHMAIAALGTVRLGGWAWLFGARERGFGFPVVALLDPWDWKWRDLAYRWGAAIVLRSDASFDDLIEVLQQAPSRVPAPSPSSQSAHAAAQPETRHAGPPRAAA